MIVLARTSQQKVAIAIVFAYPDAPVVIVVIEYDRFAVVVLVIAGRMQVLIVRRTYWITSAGTADHHSFPVLHCTFVSLLRVDPEYHVRCTKAIVFYLHHIVVLAVFWPSPTANWPHSQTEFGALTLQAHLLCAVVLVGHGVLCVTC